MTKNEWIHYAKTHKDKLVTFLNDWHPSSNGQIKYHEMKITAMNAERACEVVRQEVRKKQQESNPVEQFEFALKCNDIETINRLLNSAWFGVPESTGCWNQIGFREAVELMDDLPEGDD